MKSSARRDIASRGAFSTSALPKYSPSLRSLLFARKWDEALRRLRTNPEEAKEQDRLGDTCLHEVCHSGAPFPVIQKLLHANKDALSTKGFCGRLPIHYAAYNKPQVNVIKLLLKHYPEGAKVLDADGRLPLHLAVIRNANKQTIQALIEAYPQSLNKSNGFGNTPAMLCRNEHVEALLEEEKQRPRGIQNKMKLEWKLVNNVWQHGKMNPLAPTANDEKRNDKSSTRNRSSKTKPKMNGIANALKMVDENKHRKLTVRKDPASTMQTTRTIMAQNNAKVIPTPEKGKGNYYGKEIMSTYRKTELPCPEHIDSPALCDMTV
jgi:ankyrin repeat protein